MFKPRRLLVAVAALALSAAGLTASPAAAAPDPTTCVGYKERRQFVDSQAWWLNDPARGLNGDTRGHAHLGACVPDRETVTGIIPLDLRVILHENPGTLSYVAVVFKTASTETTIATKAPALKCAAVTCAFWFHFDVDMAKFPNAGLEEIRFRTTVKEKNSAGVSQEMRPSMSFLVNVANGKTVKNVTRYPWLRGKGWYTGPLYCEASLISAMPDGPVSGVWAPKVILDDHDGGTAGDAKVTHHTVRLDPDFHAVPEIPGKIINDGPDGLPATSLSIDTTKLANGPHKLHLRSDCDVPSVGSVNSGVLVVPFTVANP